jgi:hypothetical protein
MFNDIYLDLVKKGFIFLELFLKSGYGFFLAY